MADMSLFFMKTFFYFIVIPGFDTYLHRLLLFCVKYDTFPNLSGANIQYREEYYNFSESYF